MLEALESIHVAHLPLAPKNPLRYRHQLRALRSLIDGHQELLDAGHHVGRAAHVLRVHVPAQPPARAST